MGALLALRSAIPILVGVFIGIFGANTFADFVTIPAARKQGAQEERLVHEEQRRKAEAQADADRRTAQARIDAIERTYHQRTAEQAMQLDALEASIAQETSRVPPPPSADRGSACRPAVPRSLRDALQPLGRPAPRLDPAGSASAVR